MNHRSLFDRPEKRSLRRRGFTLAECSIALAALAVIAVLVAELAAAALADRSRVEAQMEAAQVATNILEEARSLSWEGVTADWAKAQKLSSPILARWPNTKLQVRVEPEANRPKVKRVTVELTWEGSGKAVWLPVTMTALFAARTVGGGS